MPPTTRFAFRKGQGTCNALLCVSHTLQSALESGQEAGIVQIDFSAAFDRVNHQGTLYKLCSVGILGTVLAMLTPFLFPHPQCIMVDGCWSKLVNIVLIGYDDDSNFIAAVPSPGVRVTVAELVNRDLGKLSEWGARLEDEI